MGPALTSAFNESRRYDGSARLLDHDLWPSATQQLFRSYAEKPFKMTRKMALVEETDMVGSFADGDLPVVRSSFAFLTLASTTYW